MATQTAPFNAANDNPSGATGVQIAFKSLAVLLARAELRAQSRATANLNCAPRQKAQP
ncbi:hypothetical protein DSM110093_03134 [Sulfitobacter sp. DSM 110093]|uniref:hypothetical protein n=1 Tax=Sulfitobacter sp. DSM 110093 TaxID=2883127 RepID=UPI001FACD52F|nr:hypothetical protein [Sulfitobacter sp. DSM 110093]UOA33309.1 hypothetical protein DSM110093_03134 [Sulfitobacter sp. DSM 110093]